MTAPLTISAPPIDAMAGWHGIMADPASLHASVSLHVGDSQFVLPLCPDTIFSTKPQQTGHIAPARTLLRLGEDTGFDMQLLPDATVPASEDAKLSLPDGWQFEAASAASSTGMSGRVTLASDARAGHYRIQATLADEPVYTAQELAYAHIRR